MEIEELKEKLVGFDKAKIAREIVWWIAENVKNFIDTKQHVYSLSFLAHEELMPETAKFEALCREVDKIEIDVTGDVDQMNREIEENPEVAKAAEMQVLIIDFMEEVRGVLANDDKATQDVIKAFSWYYDFVGYNEKAEQITRPLNGFVEFRYLSFENMEVSVTKTPMIPVLDKQGKLIEYKRDPSKAETLQMPASFCIDLVVQLWEEKGESSLF